MTATEMVSASQLTEHALVNRDFQDLLVILVQNALKTAMVVVSVSLVNANVVLVLEVMAVQLKRCVLLIVESMGCASQENVFVSLGGKESNARMK